jgi:hypothetical protein
MDRQNFLKTDHLEEGETEDLYYDGKLWGCKVDLVGLGPCPIAVFDITRFHPIDSTTEGLVQVVGS